MNINQIKISTDQHFILCSGKWKHVLVGLSWFECNAELTTIKLATSGYGGAEYLFG